MIDDIKNLLRKHDFITTVRATEEGCVIKYPHTKLNRKNNEGRLIETYKIERGEKPGFRVTTTFLDDEHFIDVPEYAMRLFLVSEIGLCCNHLGISPKLVDYINIDGDFVSTVHEILRHPGTHEELQKEGFLNKLYAEALVDLFPPEYENVAATHNVLEGYQVLTKFFKESTDE